MRQRVFSSARPIGWLLVFAALLAPALSLSGQTFVPPTLPAAANQVSIPQSAADAASAITDVIRNTLTKGRTLESNGLWAEALTYYEEALREYPQDRALQDRFDVARLHYSLEQRYDDRSFQDSVKTLRPQQALDLYGDLLAKINAHYYTTPPWKDLVKRGAQAMDIALANEGFLVRHGIRTRGEQLNQVRGEMMQLAGKYQINSSRDASAVTTQIARLGRERIGLSETATYLEFTAAAAGGLDHYSAFLTADQLRDIYSQIEGNFVGLGVELKADNGALLIVRVIPRSPAEKAGIKADDRIVGVDGQATKSLSTDEAAAMLTGAEGSLVRVAVLSPGQTVRELSIQRAHVDVPALENVKILEPATGIAYVKIPAFQKTTAADLEAALWDLHRQGMRSLIIDLRGNPGGLLTASVEVADKFIADGGIVSTRGRSEQENFNYRAHRPGTWRVPLVVLIDGDSASASEIFAGAIKDSGRGTIVGVRSYGKGSVQGIFPLGTSGAGARITTASFYSPLGHPISKVGITPDVDARRATLAANGEQNAVAATAPLTADANSQLVGFRGTDGAAASPAPATAPVNKDQALDTAIQIARKQPVAQL
jgi:carboxyl-terminal processing protease